MLCTSYHSEKNHPIHRSFPPLKAQRCYFLIICIKFWVNIDLSETTGMAWPCAISCTPPATPDAAPLVLTFLHHQHICLKNRGKTCPLKFISSTDTWSVHNLALLQFVNLVSRKRMQDSSIILWFCHISWQYQTSELASWWYCYQTIRNCTYRT